MLLLLLLLSLPLRFIAPLTTSYSISEASRADLKSKCKMSDGVHLSSLLNVDFPRNGGLEVRPWKHQIYIKYLIACVCDFYLLD